LKHKYGMNLLNAVELIGLRVMMLHRQYDKIAQYEKEWRIKFKIPAGQPSTLVVKQKRDKEKMTFQYKTQNQITIN